MAKKTEEEEEKVALPYNNVRSFPMLTMVQQLFILWKIVIQNKNYSHSKHICSSKMSEPRIEQHRNELYTRTQLIFTLQRQTVQILIYNYFYCHRIHTNQIRVCCFLPSQSMFAGIHSAGFVFAVCYRS